MSNLKNIRDALSLWRTELDKLSSALESKLQRLSFLMESPLPPSEIADYVIDAMRRHGARDFYHFLDQKLAHAISNPLLDANPEWRPGILGGVNQPNVLSPFCLFHLLKEPLEKSIRENILTWDGLPSESGPPRAEREAEILVLERDIEKLRGKIEAERQAARGAGVELSGLHQRDRTPTRPRDLKSSE